MRGLEAFHEAVATWFGAALGAPTEVQREGWAAIQAGRDVLVSAPTGSGKTLAAFFAAIDALVRESLACRGLPDETRVLYVSPLKALSNDIEKNLAVPLAGIDEVLAQRGLPAHGLRVGLRTGDTPARDRAKAAKRPPHLFVTTPESFYLLLTSESGRKLLSTVRAVVVDEIHALVGNKRGSHLALSLERLDALVGRPVQRIGLSATQRPIEDVARFLVGAARCPAGHPECDIVDAGHARTLDLALELPASPLEPVMAAEVWQEIHARLAVLVTQHRTTLVFVNTRRLAERLARHLAELLGKDRVASHHGSLSRELRLDAEQRLKRGELAVLVATASLELGIDVGAVELVCQIGSPRAIAAFLQRVGRSGHFLGGLPKGRLFPTSRDDLVECLALLSALRTGEIDRVRVPEAPLDVLAQQIVAEVALTDWSVDALYSAVTRAWPYRNLTRTVFDQVLRMLADGFVTRRGRRSAHVHLDGVNGRVRGRRGAALTATSSGGAIPENTEYAVQSEPDGGRVGTVHEDFAIESAAGDIFQLGNTSWRILRVTPGVVRVEDARGQPPTIPFWVAEAPGRTRELSQAVERLFVVADGALEGGADVAALAADLAARSGTRAADAHQAAEYLAESRLALGALPHGERVLAERFFDEAGNQHLVIHSRRGARLNRAWGLALRKSFCRTFDFELQAAATDDALILSLGPTHSFPAADAFTLLRRSGAERLLEQAVLDAPVFGIRWRWASTIALAIPRMRGGKRTPPPIQRMMAEDLLALAFPDAQACLENVVGDREIPDHPLVRQALDDCLHEALDARGFLGLLGQIEDGTVRTLARDLTQPSPLAAEILGARPYAFLDDAPLEERRTQAVMMRRWLGPENASDLGALDAAAIARVRDEAWPDPRDADEVHDALVVHGYFTEAEARGDAGLTRDDLHAWLGELGERGRACRLERAGGLWVAAERLSEVLAAVGDAPRVPRIAPAPGSQFHGDPAAALREVVRSRLEGLGPTTAADLAREMALDRGAVEVALAALEGDGSVLRGRFTPGLPHDLPEEWCDRRLLARIHRATLERLRREIEPVSSADLQRFLLDWQRVSSATRAQGAEGLAAVLAQLEGVEVPVGAWETDVLPARVQGYDPAWLDALCLAGRVTWRRGTPSQAASPVRGTPVALVARAAQAAWGEVFAGRASTEGLSTPALAVHAELATRGACFFDDLLVATRLLRTQLEAALGELVARGLVTSDGWAGLRALVAPAEQRSAHAQRARRRAVAPIEAAGRWSAVPLRDPEASPSADAVEALARTLLRRWGVVVRRLVERESVRVPWRDLLRALHRLEARGEIRGGRFVALPTGEQFALPEAVGLLREVRRRPARGELLALSACDPLALVGVLTPGARVAAQLRNRVLYRDGHPVAALEGGVVRFLAELGEADRAEASRALVRVAATRPRLELVRRGLAPSA